MPFEATPLQWVIATLLVFSAVGVVSCRKPLYSALSFLGTLLLLAAYYFTLAAEFIASMQVLVYAGAILVIFVFVIVLFQDAHVQIDRFPAASSKVLLAAGACFFAVSLGTLGWYLFASQMTRTSPLPANWGLVKGIGEALYLDFFFPFEAIIVLFLVAMIGALYLARREE